MRKKTVTAKVIEANRKNSQKSTGPKSDIGKKFASSNALTHGMCSRALHFDTDDDRMEFDQLIERLMKDYCPANCQEELFVIDIATLFWRSFRCARLVEAALEARERAAFLALEFFVNSSFEILDPRRNAFEQSTSMPLGKTHHCRELILTNRVAKNSQEGDFGNTVRRSDDTGCDVKFQSSLETLLRYEAQIKRDLHRAIDQLERLQGRRGVPSGA